MTAHRVPAEQDRTVSSVKTKDQTPIIAAHGVSKEFLASDGNPFLALDDVSIEVGEGEIVALLGTSGSGKSTLLRLLAGLLVPTHGHVTYRGGPVDGPNPGVSMVFQSFALLPWLTVQQNVELGLEAQGVPPAERHDRALAAIDLIGLDGFEQAYPKELSGGMRQRVGFARSVVMEPDVLLMDEPFSALDVLTAENLRGELLRLWDDHKFPTKALLLVTHNIEEAVLLADRVVILSSGPGRVKGAFPIPLPRPRDRRAPDFIKITDTIYELLTQKEGTQKESSTAVFVDTVGVGEDTTPSHLTLPAPSLADSPLPKASVDGIGGLLDILVPRGGRDDIPELASRLHLPADALLPLLDAAELLGLVTIADADVYLTPAGSQLAAASILDAKRLFATAVLERAPLVQTIHSSLVATDRDHLSERFFLDLLETAFSGPAARAQLDVAIDWGRYAELFDYDADTGHLRLDPGGATNEPSRRA